MKRKVNMIKNRKIIQNIAYLKYIIKHKRNVFKTAWKRKQYIHAFTHDIDKFLPWRFAGYRRNFYPYTEKPSYEDSKAMSLQWQRHYRNNKHHWQYWIVFNNPNDIRAIDMPYKYIQQMLADWEAMGNPVEYYFKNYDNIILSDRTRHIVDSEISKMEI